MVFDPGLTVVVGPNGSGKSNVSDAILWVLGEQSAKQLRGNAMEDVIFSGSSARKPVGVAEVTLVLDNSDHTLPVEFDEVGITRRMYRSGESEYLINGAPARLMDIQDILHDSGLGKDTHSIISQGKLDAILSSRPEERRSLIEEAAGISKHRRRKERSAKKLKDMDANVVRARDLVREINRQLRPLERQVDKAQRFNELDERRAFLATTLSVDDLRQLQAEWQAVAAAQTEAEANAEICEFALAEKTKKLEKLQVMLEQKGLFVGDLGEQRRRMQQQLGRLDSDMRLLEEKGRNMVEKLSEMRMTLSNVDRERRQSANELMSAQRELEEASANAEVARATLAEVEPQLAAAKAERTRLDEAFSEATAKQRAEKRDNDAAVLGRARLKEQMSNASVEDELYASRLEQLEESQTVSETSLNESRATLANLEHELAAVRKQLDGQKASIDAASAALREARSAADAAKSARTQAEAKQSALASVDRDVERSHKLATKVREEAAGTGARVVATLSDYVKAPAALEATLERYLGETLQALVVATGAELTSLAELAVALDAAGGAATLVAQASAAAEGAGRASEPAVAEVRARAEAALKTAGVSAEAVYAKLEVDEASEPVIEALLGAVFVTATVAEALAAHAAAPEVTVLSLDGACVYADGRVVVGTAGAAEAGVLERKRTLRALEAELPQLVAAVEAAEAQAQEAQVAVRAAREAEEQLRAQASRLRGDAEAARKEIGRLEGEVARTKAEHDTVAKRRAEAAERAEKARPELEACEATVARTQAALEALATTLEELGSAREAASEQELTLSRTVNETKLELATALERKRHLEKRTGELEARDRALVARSDAARTGSRSLEVLRLRIDPLHERYEALREVAMAWAERLRDSASLAEADSDSLKKTITDAKDEVAEANQALAAAREALAGAKVEAGRLEVQVEAALERIKTVGHVPVEEALTFAAPEDREALEHELAVVEKRIASLGPVNQVAMEEYTRLKERSDYLEAQLADLESAKAALAKITAAIDRKMKTAFIETYETVNHNFSQVFALLFPGGSAHLEMTDPEHPTETGIEVIAQPRGKRIPKLVLLSGGEKSLVALALLFAVYKTRTVPFYVFDEVEAALDDSNLDKLLGAIDTLKQTTQLIVISHQRRTMEQADVLYGVSMRSDGVSHVISQRLDALPGAGLEG
jgi:chromosome segregation protein